MFRILGTVPYSWLRPVFLAAFIGVCAAHSASSVRLHFALFSSEQWDCENSDVRLRRGEEREGATRKRPFFSDTEAILYVVNRGAYASKVVQRLNRRNCRTNPAACNASAEQKSKDSPWRSFLIDHICQGRIWYETRCYRKDRDYKTISNKSGGKMKLLTSVGITCNNMDGDMLASGYFSVHFFTNETVLLRNIP